MGVSSGYIRYVYISLDANDTKTYIPFVDGYFGNYKIYPDIVDTDAGYGSYDNYAYNNIYHFKQYSKVCK